MTKTKRPRSPLIPPEGTRYLTDPQICHRFGVSKQTLWRWRATRGFPAGTKAGGDNAPNRTAVELVEQWEAANMRSAVA